MHVQQSGSRSVCCAAPFHRHIAQQRCKIVKRPNVTAIALGLLTVFSVSAAGPNSVAALPERILSGYYGCNVTRKGDFGRNMHMIDVLAAHGFNSYETKIQGRGRHFDVVPHVGPIKEMADRAKSKGMIFQIYLYTVPYLADRHADWAEHASLPPPVSEGGKEIANAFLLTDPAVWRQLFHHAFGFASHQKEIGFASLKFDVERISEHVSYDDATWNAFCAASHSCDPATPARDRARRLSVRRGGKAAYRKFYYAQVEKAIAQFVKEIRAINPNIILGYMPARHRGELSEILNRVLAAPGIPAIVDGWDMYNGSGYVDASTQKNVARARKGNPDNRYVTWIRPDNYIPEDISVAAYHAGARTAGYSIWTLAMLDDSIPPKKRRYPLQKGVSMQDCLTAFARANEAVRADIAENTLQNPSRIPFKTPSVRVAALDISKVRIPRLKAVGAGSTKPCSLTLREQQTLLMPRKAGEAISIRLSHLSRRHHAALQYAVLDPSGRVLRNEAVTRLQSASFMLSAPEDGTYALVVTGGRGGQAWYRVSINGAWCLDARKRVYLFNPQTIYMPGGKSGNSGFNLAMGTPRQEYVCRIADGSPVTNSFSSAVRTFALPATECAKVEFSPPSKNSYSQDYMIDFPKGSAEPFLFADPDAATGLCR